MWANSFFQWSDEVILWYYLAHRNNFKKGYAHWTAFDGFRTKADMFSIFKILGICQINFGIPPLKWSHQLCILWVLRIPLLVWFVWYMCFEFHGWFSNSGFVNFRISWVNFMDALGCPHAANLFHRWFSLVIYNLFERVPDGGGGMIINRYNRSRLVYFVCPNYPQSLGTPWKYT